MADHQGLRRLAKKFQACVESQSADLAAVLSEFQSAVQEHFKREDLYYRILDQDKRLDDRTLVHSLRNDHAAVIFTLESLVIRLRKAGMEAEWKRRYKNLMAVFIPHLDQEENVLFPLAAKVFTPDDLLKLEEEMT